MDYLNQHYKNREMLFWTSIGIAIGSLIQITILMVGKIIAVSIA